MKQRVIFGSNHQGGALQNMVKEYPNVPAVLKELVQNSIDVDLGGASKIEITIDLDQGTLSYLDNGPGLTGQTFEEAVKTFGHSIKRGDKYGRFGIGLASPLSVAADFRFVTAPSGSRYRSYHFDRAKLFGVVSGGYPIVEEEVNHLFHGDNRTPGVRPKQSEVVWWRTGVFMSGLTEDRQKRRLDIETLQEEVQSAYGKKLVELDTKITIMVIEGGVSNETTFKAKLYQGKRLPEWTTIAPDVGKVVVRLHLAPIGYVGKLRLDVGSGNNPSRVSLNRLYLTPYFYACLSDATKSAFKSGLFQGELIGQNLQLLTNRRGFVQDDALFALAVALDDWYKQVGCKYHEDEKRERMANRYQAIGLAAIERLKSSILGPDSPFASILAQAEFGSVGKGHAAVPKKTLTGQELMGKATGGQKAGGAGGGGARDANQERPQHHPDVVVGPEGQRRQVVKGHSTGFHMNFTDTGERMFWFNRLGSCITINNTHPTFVLLEKSDNHLERYYTMLIATALRLELEDDERLKEAQYLFAEGLVHDWANHVLKT
jgi:Histidine kinase-, DNA gyrase B-, and HSP90-like ATPase